MGLIIVLIVGALVGWVAGMIMKTGGGLIFDIIVGIVGALLAGFLFGGGRSLPPRRFGQPVESPEREI